MLSLDRGGRTCCTHGPVLDSALLKPSVEASVAAREEASETAMGLAGSSTSRSRMSIYPMNTSTRTAVVHGCHRHRKWDSCGLDSMTKDENHYSDCDHGSSGKDDMKPNHPQSLVKRRSMKVKDSDEVLPKVLVVKIC
jgi:hypothetical protein